MTDKENERSMALTVAAFNGDPEPVEKGAQVGFSPFDMKMEPDDPNLAENIQKVRDTAVKAIDDAIAAGQAWQVGILLGSEVQPGGVSLDTITIGVGTLQEQMFILTGVGREIQEEMQRVVLNEFVTKGGVMSVAPDGSVEIGGIDTSAPEPCHMVADDDGMQAAIGSAHIEDKNHNGVDDAVEGYTGPDTWATPENKG